MSKHASTRLIAASTAALLWILAPRLLAGDGGDGGAAGSEGAEPAAAPDGVFDPLRGIGMLLERAVKERSEWQDMAIAILKGEAMSPRNPWWRPSRCLYDWEWLRARFDRDADERVGRAELAGAEELFARLDRDADGALAAADLDPAAAAVSRPEVEALFRFLDHDANHKVSWDELSWFFQQADRRKRGFLSPEDLQAVLAPALLDGEKKREGEEKEAMPSRRRLLSLLLRGELGSFAPGPELGQAAPEIRLPRHRGGDGEPPPVLAEHRGRRPVVLIFGSFT